ncbi:hypothetical protein SMACR_07036 [Sordaria macrospora]|uniref:Uncharacterized protein n=1 Tax=Sordaria macrospora TaxID=5147 RepID=A0A8S8ZTQ7_SORMA|nr:hypothetical protein SMACR_07036 [Sordaria macrospora]WPJ60007.1 hypothetical protein SMAC4_07036 [Sordaria macrospora]
MEQSDLQTSSRGARASDTALYVVQDTNHHREHRHLAPSTHVVVNLAHTKVAARGAHYTAEVAVSKAQNGSQNGLLGRLRLGHPRLATGHRATTHPRQANPLGLPRLRSHRRQLRLLGSGRGRATAGHAPGAQAGHSRQEGAEGGEATGGWPG